MIYVVIRIGYPHTEDCLKSGVRSHDCSLEVQCSSRCLLLSKGYLIRERPTCLIEFDFSSFSLRQLTRLVEVVSFPEKRFLPRFIETTLHTMRRTRCTPESPLLGGFNATDLSRDARMLTFIRAVLPGQRLQSQSRHGRYSDDHPPIIQHTF